MRSKELMYSDDRGDTENSPIDTEDRLGIVWPSSKVRGC
jgi:hypothetical protein